ncbi:related to cytoskeletal adaptor [Cephalotrichum gorgonifer]|uniref:Related to cytoskeletal adaptor n=1 Tax=Cephalotrichum gorgonifer TaxID=2041049 RepID=A0AAE8MX86_9PEZI|nr:related to cytoskeletal adaptor [Cephalotrichum gorgonifer]
MDFNSLKDTVSNLTLYDVKASVRKVQNAVMNYTEMEAKVREATNNEPWGASTTLMQEIANGTFNYQTLNEIMPMIYRRFTEKTAEEWRQIYKSLQLLEFLVKHGSERVIDDARSHLTLLKMLRQFHYIDQNGKDQGINVRNRAKELAELLSDVERIRTERKKARATKNKYTGVEGGTGLGGGMSGGGSRYGGFGSESSGGGYGGYAGGVYGDGGGFGGQSNDYSGGGGGGGSGGSNQFEEYDEFDGDRPTPSTSRPRPSERASAKKPAEAPKKKEPEVDLFSFDDEPTPAPAATRSVPAPSSSGLADLSGPASADDDEFDDFVSAAPSAQPIAPSAINPLSPPIAPSAPSQFAAPQPVSAPQQANLTNMVKMSSLSPVSSSTTTPSANYSAFTAPPTASSMTSPAAKPATFQPTGPNYFQSVQASAPSQQQNTGNTTMSALKPVTSSSTGAKPAAGGDAFGALWSQASVGLKKTNAPTSGPALGQLAKEKSSAGIWGAPSQTQAGSQQQGNASGKSAFDDLLG